MPHSPATNNETSPCPLPAHLLLAPSSPQLFTHLMAAPISKRNTASGYSKPVQLIMSGKRGKKINQGPTLHLSDFQRCFQGNQVPKFFCRLVMRREEMLRALGEGLQLQRAFTAYWIQKGLMQLQFIFISVPGREKASIRACQLRDKSARHKELRKLGYPSFRSCNVS